MQQDCQEVAQCSCLSSGDVCSYDFDLEGAGCAVHALTFCALSAHVCCLIKMGVPSASVVLGGVAIDCMHEIGAINHSDKRVWPARLQPNITLLMLAYVHLRVPTFSKWY